MTDLTIITIADTIMVGNGEIETITMRVED